MAIKQIYYNTFSNRPYFEMTSGKRPWDIFLLLTDGAFSIKMSNKELVISKGEILYIPANVYIERKIISPISFHQFAFVASQDQPFYSSLTEGKLNVDKDNLNVLVKTLVSSAFLPKHSEVVRHCIERIMCEHYLSCSKVDEIGSKFSKDIYETLSFFNDNFDKKIDLKELANKMGLSYTGFLWKFEKQVGTTPLKYLSHVRLRYAKQLLIEGDLTISEISALCGYSNPYYFTNVFKEKYGLCPTSYRKEETLKQV